jgi:energy-coupling factor transporter ATP-binding protein EcfA2
MWIEELHLENIKCFETLKLKLGMSNSSFRWVTLLGENGTGKSTILQAISLLLAGPEGAIQLLPRPEGWVRREGKPGKITLRLHQGENDPGHYRGPIKERKVFQYTLYVTGSHKITINNKVFTEPVITEDTNSRVIPWLREHALLPKGKGWFGVGYGAFRRLTRVSRILVPALKEPLRYTNFITQFNESEPLEAFEQWMVYLDYKINKGSDPLAKKQYDLAVATINKLLPKGNCFDSIDDNGRIWFRVGSERVMTIALSDGFRSILALAGDLVWRLIEAFPKSDSPLEEQGVVLIDELDIHLHPTWQYEIASWLQATFPSLQFVMATHSPIIAAGAGSQAVTYRFYIKDGNVNVEQVKNTHAYNINRILQSEAFGLVSPFSKETQHKIDRYYALKRKKDLSQSEQQELQMTLPIIEQAIGYGTDSSETEQRLNQYLKEHFK